MGATYTRQSASAIVDGGVIEASDINAEFNQVLAAFAVTSGHTHDGTAAEGGPITKLLGTAITIGDATAGTDIALTFDGESNDGVVTWMEDEDYFQFSDDLLLTTTEKLQFRDTAIYINSSADGQLDLVADTEIQIAATTIDINGAVDISGALTLAGTTLAETISDTVGAMVSSNTETGITVTYEDSDNTLDFALGAAQTTITSLFATDIKIGEDDQTKIDFETADEIHFYAANVEQVYLGDNIFGPQSDSDVDLGSTGVRWKDAFIDTITTTGNITVGGDLTVTGDDITMGTNTAGNLLVADGTNFNSIAVSSLSEISTAAADDVFIAIDTSGGGLKKIARSAVVAGLATDSAISNVVDDTTPQLGGNLDMNGADIVTTSNADLELAPNGTGHVTIRGNTNPGTIQFNCESNSHGQQLKAQPHSVASSAVHTLPNVTGELMPGKIEGTNFTDSLLVGHATTGTLDAAEQNVGVGIAALDAITSGDNNTAVGYEALTGNQGGSNNTGLGHDALKVNNDGNENTAIGSFALDSNSSGDRSVAIGDHTLATNSTGGNSTAIGRSALETSNGNYNIGIGSSSGDNISSGSGNVIIGSVDAASATGARQLKIAGYDGSTTTTWISGDSSGNLTFAGDVTVGDDLNLTTDSTVINFGADSDTTLTHTDGTGLTLNSTNKLCFNDATQFIQGASGTVLDIAATDEIELTATLIDVVGNLAGSGTGTFGGILKTDDATEATSTTDGSLQTDGGLSVVKDAIFGDDVTLISDASVLKFGANAEVTLTHVHNDGLLLNADMQLQFRDSAINIRSDADGDLDINADDEVEINSTLIDVNGNLDVSGTLAQAGVATFALAANVAQVALSSSSNAIAWDASAAANAYHVTTENTTFSAPSNAVEGAFICVEINYNGSHTIAFNTVFEFAASTAPTTTDTDGKTDILVFRYNGAVWQEVGRTLNLSES
jgi:hypothetical protein